MPWYKDIELLRAYMRGLIVLLFMSGLGYVLTNHISMGTSDVMAVLNDMEYFNHEERLRAFNLIENSTASQIPSGSVWSWFTGVVTGTLIIYYFGEKTSAEK